ncbi:WD40 repeat-like protein [Macroventuria anomochaeta]|uniref:WD40 repeat-like protein n=1 Tax=Macroventuria anomochaeta TaxID=301207 RepID=A0ACB6RU92_9PLEO|nr:WD40 repeat-like protein [Macroventuria anomochaeta]KAF2625471.1 WD40 repeat-like protein [Macroventuria anomochaeta]
MATTEATPVGIVKAERTCCPYKDLVKEWTFPLKPLHDFELNGEVAQYAPGHPRQWGDETHWLNFQHAIRDGQPESPYESYYAAISPDHKLLAITSTHERILVYNIESQELCQVVDGVGYLVFAPLRQPTERKSAEGETARPPTPVYALICSASDEGRRTGVDNQLVAWEFDEQGRLLDQEEPIDASAFAAQAIDAILPDLTRKHEWSKDFVKASLLHTDFAKALKNVATTHRRRHNTVFDDAELGGFGSTSFSSDAKLFLYHTQNKSTQSGMRDPDDLPRVIVMDVINGKELHRLSGHTDAIMWSAISPNEEHIASVAWDGTLRMYSAATGELEWVTTGGGQAWTGAFSADSKHIVWSTGNGQALFVHDAQSGQGRASFPEGFDFRDWCRSLAWHPDGQQIALCTGKHAYVWRPFDGTQGTITQHYQIEDDKNRGCTSVEHINWLDDGRLLHLYFSDGTNLVYDTQRNSKELFMHPKDVDSVWVSNGFHGNIKITGIRDGYVSVDGDGKVRYWSSGIVIQNSWWENAPEKEEQETSSKKKTPFPETGKYVMVTRRSEKGKTEQRNETVGETSSS